MIKSLTMAKKTKQNKTTTTQKKKKHITITQKFRYAISMLAISLVFISSKSAFQTEIIATIKAIPLDSAEKCTKT